MSKDQNDQEKQDNNQSNNQKELEEVEKHSQPMWLTDQFVNKPIVVMVIIIAFALACMGISIAIDGFKMADSSDREYLIWSNERVKDFDKFYMIRKEYLKSQTETTIPERSQYVEDWNTNVIVKCDDCDDEDGYNVLKAKNIKKLYEAEQGFLNLKKYKDYCLATVDSSDCAQGSFISFTSLFTKSQIENLTDEMLQDKLKEVTNDETLYDEWKGFFSKKFDKNYLKSSVLRSQFKFGGPIKKNNKGELYRDIYDEEQEQKKDFEDFCKDMVDYFRDDLDSPGGVLMFPTSDVLHDYVTLSVVGTDFLLAFGSIMFVLFYVSLHLKSFFLGSMGMLNILYSFPISMTFFNGMFQIDYFSTLHVLVIFIILGISADNIFVYTDCWNQTEKYQSLMENQNKRMAYTFRRASKAMLATSSTTAAAFLATGLSDIMPISSFGFFAGILVPVNFVLVITYYPSALIIYENKTKNMCVRKNRDNDQQEQEQEKKQEPKKIEVFFNDQVTSFTYKFRYIITVVFLIWTGIAIWRNTKLPGMSEQVSFLPDDYDAQQAKDAIINSFRQAGNSDQGIKVYQFWGVQKMDKSGTSMWDPEDIGKVVWDKNFDLASNQQYLYDYCVSMKDNKIVQDGQTMCFIESFRDYIVGKGQQFPVQTQNFIQELKLYTKEDGMGQVFKNANFIGLFGDELRYIMVQFSSHGQPFAPYKQLNPFYEEWQDFIKDFNKNAPQGLKNSRQTAVLHWLMMVTEKALVDNAIQGVLISLAFAFVVLVCTTYNIILAIYSVISIGSIVVSVIAIIEMIGWELGVSESVAIVILIGLSVDYVVHLANHYVECTLEDRYSKTQVALRDLGISIVSGASTTLGSALFLFFATITLFNKFAILIFSTIILSLVYSIVQFSAVLHAFGPEKGLGDISKMFRGRRNSIRIQNIESPAGSIDKQQNNNVKEKDATIVAIQNIDDIEENQQIQQEKKSQQ